MIQLRLMDLEAKKTKNVLWFVFASICTIGGLTFLFVIWSLFMPMMRAPQDGYLVQETKARMERIARTLVTEARTNEVNLPKATEWQDFIQNELPNYNDMSSLLVPRGRSFGYSMNVNMADKAPPLVQKSQQVLLFLDDSFSKNSFGGKDMVSFPIAPQSSDPMTIIVTTDGIGHIVKKSELDSYSW